MCPGEYLQQATVTLLPLLHVQVPAARPPQQPLRPGYIEQTHPAAVQQADRQVGSAAAAELLTGHEAGGQRSQAVNTTQHNTTQCSTLKRTLVEVLERRRYSELLRVKASNQQNPFIVGSISGCQTGQDVISLPVQAALQPI